MRSLASPAARIPFGVFGAAVDRRTTALAAGAFMALVAACTTNPVAVDCTLTPEKCPEEETAQAPRIYVNPPFGLGFSCVELGCNTTSTLTVENRGGGRLKIPSLRLGVGSSTDFSFTLSPIRDPAPEGANSAGSSSSSSSGAAASDDTEILPPTPDRPFELLEDQLFDIAVTYKPSDAVNDTGSISIQWYNGSGSAEDADIETVDMPLTARVFGDATARVQTPELAFGLVPAGSQATLNAVLENASQSAAILALSSVTMEAGTPPAFTIVPGFSAYANTGQQITIPVRFAPAEEAAYSGALLIATNDPDQPTIRIPLTGTSLTKPRLTLVEPRNGELAFGNLRYHTTATRQIKILNQGGSADTFTVQMLSGVDAGFALPQAPPTSIGTMQEMTLSVTLTPPRGGDLVGLIRVTAKAKDGTSEVNVTLTGYGDAPRATVTPTSLDFGTLVEGWTSDSQSLEVRNVGTSVLTIQSVELETGSSSQIHLAQATPSPCPITPMDPPYKINVYVQGVAAGNVTGTVLIKTDSIDGDTLRVPVTAVVKTCAQYCVITNGTGTCAVGTCDIAGCNAGWHNLDGALANGCECQEDDFGHDIAGVCNGGKDLGTVSDCNSPNEVTYSSANLHSAADMDLYYVRTEDAWKFLGCDQFGDSSRVKVELLSGPPGLGVCVMVRGWGDGCGGYQTYFNPANCWTSSNRPWVVVNNEGGSGDDSHTVVVQVMWYPGAAPVCQNYSIKIRGKD